MDSVLCSILERLDRIEKWIESWYDATESWYDAESEEEDDDEEGRLDLSASSRPNNLPG